MDRKVHSDLSFFLLAQKKLVRFVKTVFRNQSPWCRVPTIAKIMKASIYQHEYWKISPSWRRFFLTSYRSLFISATQKKLPKSLEKFVACCGFNLEQPSFLLILELLQDGLDIGLSPSTLGLLVSALCALHDSKLSEVNWISRFLNAWERLKPRVKNLFPPCNFNWVLKGLLSLSLEPFNTSTYQVHDF